MEVGEAVPRRRWCGGLWCRIAFSLPPSGSSLWILSLPLSGSFLACHHEVAVHCLRCVACVEGTHLIHVAALESTGPVTAAWLTIFSQGTVWASGCASTGPRSVANAMLDPPLVVSTVFRIPYRFAVVIISSIVRFQDFPPSILLGDGY